MNKILLARIQELSGLPITEMAEMSTLKEIEYVSEDELKDILKKVWNYKSGLKTAEKEKKPRKRMDINTRSYYAIVHPSLIADIINKNNGGIDFDLNKLKSIISEIPNTIFGTNTKMQHGQMGVFYKISLPSGRGLIFDEQENSWGFVTTCPFAGACLSVCYDAISKQRETDYMINTAKIFNLLMNNPALYKKIAINELEGMSYKKGNKNIYVRWHDAGDFFSKEYVKLVFSIARSLPNINFYTYTKSIPLIKNVPNNFILNYSYGGLKDDMIDDFHIKNAKVLLKRDIKDIIKAHGEKQYKSKINEDVIRKLKERIAEIIEDVPNDENLLTYDELMERYPPPNQGDYLKYNVIVWQGHGDDSAVRNDVRTTILIEH